jgi:DNA-binding transcriptional MerR regulator
VVRVWTLDELVDRVHAALAAEYPGAPNGRVRDLPDRRAIRWYTTTGLVDRPLAMRGRSALYGNRHLLQLVAVKRRQAQGRTLAEIQAELAGATDAELNDLARVPDRLLDAGATGDAGPARPRFWAAQPATAGSPATAASPAPADEAGPAPVGAVALGRGAVLVLPGQPTDRERREIAAAARPLIDLLAERGLLEKGDPT